MPADRITLAAIAGAHGIGGEVRLKLFAEGIDSLKRHDRVEIGGRPYALRSVREGSQGPVARIDGIADRNAAEALRGALLTVDREELPPLAEGEYYFADLIGLECVATGGDLLGHVVAVENYGAGDLIEVERPDRTRLLVPFRAPIAELRARDIVIDPDWLA